MAKPPPYRPLISSVPALSRPVAQLCEPSPRVAAGHCSVNHLRRACEKSAMRASPRNIKTWIGNLARWSPKAASAFTRRRPPAGARLVARSLRKRSWRWALATCWWPEWDRATRSMLDGIQIIQRVAARGALVMVLDKPHLDLTSTMGQGILAFLSALAQDKRERIVKRAQDGRKAAKARGVYFGRKPKVTPHQQSEGRRRLGGLQLSSCHRRAAAAGLGLKAISERYAPRALMSVIPQQATAATGGRYKSANFEVHRSRKDDVAAPRATRALILSPASLRHSARN